MGVSNGEQFCIMWMELGRPIHCAWHYFLVRGVLSHKWDNCIVTHILPSLGKRKQKDCGSQSSGRTRVKQCLLDVRGLFHSWIHSSYGTCKRSAQYEAIPSWNRKGLMGSHHWELLIVNGFWRRENQLSLRIWPLICRTCSKGWSHAHVQHKLDLVCYSFNSEWKGGCVDLGEVKGSIVRGWI